jgi:hypothetical protein
MPFPKVLSVVFNDSAQPMGPRFKSHLKLLKSDVIPQFLKCRHHFFPALQMAVLQFFVEISEQAKVAGIDVWRDGGWGALKLFRRRNSSITRCPLWGIKLSMRTEQLIPVFLREKCFFSLSKDGNMF